MKKIPERSGEKGLKNVHLQSPFTTSSSNPFQRFLIYLVLNSHQLFNIKFSLDSLSELLWVTDELSQMMYNKDLTLESDK